MSATRPGFEPKLVSRWGLALALTFCAAPAAAVPQLVGEEVRYEGGGAKMKGFVAYDKAKRGKRPGVLVVHEWWGHNDYARRRARELAAIGYVALAVDMYGDGKQAKHPGDAQKFASSVMSNLKSAEARFNAAHKLLAAHALVDGSKIAAIGYCFGGGVVLHMAKAGAALSAVASFHGTLASKNPPKPGQLKARILVAHGGADPFVPADQVGKFVSETTGAGAFLKLVVYPGVKHAFTNPGADQLGKSFNLPLAYDRAADRASWTELERFLADTFQAPMAPATR